MNTIKSTLPATILPVLIIDLLALGFILLMPAMSHMTGIPFYFIEPMRILLVVALIFSNRYNAYALAVLLPLFSFLVSGHPSPVKMIIIMAELLLNAWLFLGFLQKTKKPFLSMLTSVLLSKVFCYSMYWVVFSWAFVVEESATIFLVSQMAVTLVLSTLVAIISSKRQIRSSRD